MPNTTKSNKVKRKRGKKFVWRGSRDVNDQETGKRGPAEANPFEDHEKSQRVKKDADKRQELLEDYRRLNKNSVIRDHRIGETSSKLSEEDKMKMRYMREQRDQAKERLLEKDKELDDRKENQSGGASLSTKQTRKRTRFQLDSDDEDDNGDVFMGFTHKGKLLADGDGGKDDFNEAISQDSDDDKNDRSKRKGFLNEEMVERMNFGGGDEDEDKPTAKKSRKEVFQEIMEKSKSFDAARKEMAQINKQLSVELNDDFQDLLKVLPYEKRGVRDPESTNPALLEKLEKKFQGAKKDVKKDVEQTYDQLYASLKFQAKQAPSKREDQLTEKEKALKRKQKLLKRQAEAEEDEKEDEDDKGGIKAKRDAKLESKRDFAVAKMVKEQKDEDKVEKKAEAAKDAIAAKIAKQDGGKKRQVDDDLASEESDDDDEEESEEEGDDEEEGEESDGGSNEEGFASDDKAASDVDESELDEIAAKAVAKELKKKNQVEVESEGSNNDEDDSDDNEMNESSEVSSESELVSIDMNDKGKKAKKAIVKKVESEGDDSEGPDSDDSEGDDCDEDEEEYGEEEMEMDSDDEERIGLREMAEEGLFLDDAVLPSDDDSNIDAWNPNFKHADDVFDDDEESGEDMEEEEGEDSFEEKYGEPRFEVIEEKPMQLMEKTSSKQKKNKVEQEKKQKTEEKQSPKAKEDSHKSKDKKEKMDKKEKKDKKDKKKRK